MNNKSISFKILTLLIVVLLATFFTLTYIIIDVSGSAIKELSIELLQNKLQESFAEIERNYNNMESIGIQNDADLVKQNQEQLFVLFKAGKYKNSGHLVVLDKDMKLLAHPALPTGSSYGSKDLKEQLFSSDEGSAAYSLDNKNYICFYKTFKTWNWKVLLSIDEDEILQTSVKIRNIIILIALLASFIILYLIYLVIRRTIIVPVKNMTSILKDISEGNGNLTKRINYQSADEIGEMSGYFDKFISQVHSIVRDVKSASDNVLKISGDVNSLAVLTTENLHNQSASVEETSASISQITELSHEISSNSTSQAAGVNQTNTAVNQLDNQAAIILKESQAMGYTIGQTADHINDATGTAGKVTEYVNKNHQGLITVIHNLQKLNDNISQVSAAIEQIAVSITENSNNLENATRLSGESGKIAQDGKNVVMKTVNAMQEISSKVDNIGIVIEELKNSSARIGDVVNVINDIAEQTNLLALNAAIEAARAGEAGKGFAVVADEIRKLAEKTSSSTTQIAGTIKTIQDESGKAVASMAIGRKEVENGVGLVMDTGKALDNINGSIQKVVDLISSINSSSKEQNSAANTISRLAVDMNRAGHESVVEAQRLADATQQSVGAVQDIRNRLTSIDTAGMNRSVVQVRDLVEVMNGAVNDIKSVVHDIQKQANYIKNNAENQNLSTEEIQTAIDNLSKSNLDNLHQAEQLQNLSNVLSKESRDLSGKVSSFKI